jgi:hypothetical protein
MDKAVYGKEGLDAENRYLMEVFRRNVYNTADFNRAKCIENKINSRK